LDYPGCHEKEAVREKNRRRGKEKKQKTSKVWDLTMFGIDWNDHFPGSSTVSNAKKHR